MLCSVYALVAFWKRTAGPSAGHATRRNGHRVVVALWALAFYSPGIQRPSCLGCRSVGFANQDRLAKLVERYHLPPVFAFD
eukprot:11237060-Heterocapsa_arctica.AAC.1